MLNMKQKIEVKFCEFTGDTDHFWDEVGFKKICEYAGFAHCVLHGLPLGESKDGWRTCCSECNNPVQIKTI